MVLLAMSFPTLRYLWARSAHCTPGIFRSISTNHPPVDENKAIAVGSAGASNGNGNGNSVGMTTAQGQIQGNSYIEEEDARNSAMQMLLALPGVNMNVSLEEL